MNPLKVKATGSPITSANISGLQTMTDAEVKNYIANVITEKFASVTDGTGTAELNITTNNSGAGTSIGTFVDTTRTESIGTHPATGAVSTTTYTAKQVTAAAVESITNRPLAWDSRLEEMVDGDIDSTMDLCVEAMVAESTYTAGQYKLQATAPSGGTWVSRYTLTDTAQGGNTVTYLWQKTVSSSAPTVDLTPLKLFAGSNCKQMTEAEIEQMLPVFRNRIIETGIGTYKIQSDAPSGGTWIQTGNTFTDTREEITPQNYAGNFTGNFTGNFSGNYVGTANYSGSRTYSGNYLGNYAGSANFGGSRTDSGNYLGHYAGPANFGGSRNYTGNYAGIGYYSGGYSGLRYGPAAYLGFYAGPGIPGGYGGYATSYSGVAFYSGSRNYAGNYIGPGTPPASYTGYFEAGTYSGTYSGPANYMGAAYTGFGGNFAAGNEPMGSFANFYSGSPGFYSGPGFQETQFIGWLVLPVFYAGPSYTGVPAGAGYSGSRNYAANYVTAGNYSGPLNWAGNYVGPGGAYNTTYSGSYSGPGGSYSGSRNFAGNYAGTANYAGNYAGSRNYAGNYAGTANYAGNYSGSRNFAGNYTGGATYSGNYSGSRNYSGNYAGTASYSGNYSGSRNYTGNYAGGATYSGNYSGSRNYSGLYNGPANYLGNYSSAFSGNFTGTFSGATIQATKETVSSVKLWIRTA